MADAWNLGWKLATVLRGTAKPELLHTYSSERQKGRPGTHRLRPQVRPDVQRPTERDLGHRGRRGRSRGLPPPLRPAGPLHRGRRDPVRPIDDHRRNGPPAPGEGFPGRDALPLRPGRPAGRRQAHAPGPRRPGRRRLASLPLRRPPRPGQPGLPGPAAVRLPRLGEVPDHPVHARRCRARLGDRRPRRFPAGASRPGGQFAASSPAAQEGQVRPDRLREGVLPRPRGWRCLRPARYRP